jgi:hypothetical protein
MHRAHGERENLPRIVMKRRIYASLLAGLLGLLGAVTVSACDDNADYGYAYGGAGGPGCRQYTTCGACTPVLGCGWCQTGVGKGMCADDPNDCAGATAFSWTWDPTGCFAPIADASVTIPDAATSPAPDAAVADTGVSATVDAAPPLATDSAPPPVGDADTSDATPH